MHNFHTMHAKKRIDTLKMALNYAQQPNSWIRPIHFPMLARAANKKVHHTSSRKKRYENHIDGEDLFVLFPIDCPRLLI